MASISRRAPHFGKTEEFHSVEVASVDWAAGKLLTPAPGRKLRRPNTSPPGRPTASSLACVSLSGPMAPNKVLAMFSLDTGQVVRESHTRMGFVSSAQLAPDGRSFAVQGTDLKGRGGISPGRSVIRRGNIDCGHEEPRARAALSLVNPAWSPDGKKLYYQKLSHLFRSRVGRSHSSKKTLASGKER